jgi:uncharacterized protein YciI
MGLFVVFRNAGPNWVKDLPARQQPHWKEHAAFIDALFDVGQILLAGPFDDGSGALLIIKADNEGVARTVFDNDPWTGQGILHTADVKAFQIFLNAFQKRT